MTWRDRKTPEDIRAWLNELYEEADRVEVIDPRAGPGAEDENRAARDVYRILVRQAIAGDPDTGLPNVEALGGNEYLRRETGLTEWDVRQTLHALCRQQVLRELKAPEEIRSFALRRYLEARREAGRGWVRTFRILEPPWRSKRGEAFDRYSA
jgi:hypothetical protein